MNKKKGVSEVIVAVIMIVIVLVAVGIYWAFAKSTIESSQGNTEIQSKCLMTQIEITKATCNVLDCTLELKVTGDIPDGLSVVYKSATASAPVIEVTSNIGLVTIISTPDPTGIATPTGVTIAANYGTGANKVLCNNPIDSAVPKV